MEVKMEIETKDFGVDLTCEPTMSIKAIIVRKANGFIFEMEYNCRSRFFSKQSFLLSISEKLELEYAISEYIDNLLFTAINKQHTFMQK